jgi:SAM-dependent methyltransferase
MMNLDVRLGIALKRLLPDFESRLLLRRAINLPRDTFELLARRRDPLIPPRGLWFVGGENDYMAINEEFLGYFVNLGKLQPNHRVLDVGCGIGVVASRLTKFLTAQGSYEGFDIVRVGIDWASKNITKLYPNFHFTHTDVFNKHYNPKGTLHPESFPFPYQSCSFDFVFLKSVFTHMRPESVQHYLREVMRVLKPDGYCLITVFLLNEESNDLIQSRQSSLPISYKCGEYSVVDPEFPETTIGFPECSFLQWVQEAGLRFEPPTRYGSWCGRRQEFLSYQDICILRRASY